MKKQIISDIIAIISTVGIIFWLMTDLNGGMIIYFLSYGVIILPIIILYLISVFQTIISLFIKGINGNKIKILSHFFVILFAIGLFVYDSDIFRPNNILSAKMNDDLFYYTLVFRENNNCEMNIEGMFGYKDKIKGNYYFKGDTIIFTKVPYRNGSFIPDTILIDKKLNSIFIKRDSIKNFERTKDRSNSFYIINGKYLN